MLLPKGYVLSREERRGLVQDSWYAMILKVPRKEVDGSWATTPWQEVAEVVKEFNVSRLRSTYAARLVPDGTWYTSDNLQELATRMCVMHKLGVTDESRTAG